MQTLSAIQATGLVPIFYNRDPQIVIEVAKACAAGGAAVLEFTNRGDGALEVFTELEKFAARELPQLIIGAGSIVEAGTASQYINAGASFIVSPSTSEEVARTCNRRKIPYTPGCATPTEIGRAEELGCEIVKVFPGAEAGGPGFIKAVLGPCPWSSLMPTGGVSPTEDSLGEWFDAGVICVGMGSKLITDAAVKNRDFDQIAETVAKTLKIIAAVREKKNAKNKK